jgi:hypothetical protein
LPTVFNHIRGTLQIAVKAAVLLLFLMAPAAVLAQNTKGDRPAESNKKEKRDTRFKTRESRGEKAKTRDLAGRKLRTKNKSSANKANLSYPTPRTATRSPRVGKEREGKAYRPVSASTPRSSEQSFSGQPPRKRVEVRSATARVSKSNIYQYRTAPRSVSSRTSRNNVFTGSQYQFRNNPSPRPRDTQKAYTRTAYGKKIKVRSVTAQVKKQNIRGSSGGQYKNFRSSVVQKPVSNRTQIAKAQRLSKPPVSYSKRQATVTPRSASRSFMRSKSLNPYAGFFRVKRKGEQVTTKDLAGRMLVKRNFRSAPMGIVSRQDSVRNKKPTGERAYRGPSGGYKSATRTKPKAWVGDVAGRQVRGRNFVSKRRSMFSLDGTGYTSYTRDYAGKVGTSIPVKNPGKKANKTGRYQHQLKGIKPYKGGGSVSGSSWNNSGQPLGPKRLDARGVQYAGSIKTSRPYKGGGSVSGSSWNNSGQPLGPKRLDARGVQYSGSIKTGKPYKGGGSVSGSSWNNNGQPLGPKRLDARGVQYSGSIKTSKPYKGGGSVSGRLWNNNGSPIDPSRADARGVEYAGSIKTGKPYKGGGSISGQLWNNNGRPLGPKRLDAKGVQYSGNIKTSGPIKGGGSISGRVWNNQQQPISPRVPPDAAAEIGGYPGRFKKVELVTTMVNQGEEFTGFIKRRRYLNTTYQHSNALGKKQNKMASSAGGLHVAVKQPGWARNQNAHKDAQLKRDPGGNIFKTEGLQTPVPSPGYTQNKKANPASILKRKQTEQTFLVDNLTTKVKQPGWARNKNSHEKALLKRDPGSNVFSTDGLQVRVQSPGYTQNKKANSASIMKRKQLPESFLVDNLTAKVKQPGWARNKNAHQNALLKRDPGSNVFSTDGLQVRVPSPGYVQNKNAHSASIMKRKQSPQSFLVDNLTTKVKQPGWARNKNAHKDALLKRDPGTGVFRTDEIYGRIKAYTYKGNPSSSKNALHVREPGKAFAKAANYQGNIKMQKFDFFKHPNYHPDAAFVKNNKNNVKEERGLITNIRLLWAKVFRKNETQPEVVKEKVRKPRYDRRDVGLWYD